MAVSKVVYGGKTLIDLTGDTVTGDKLLKVLQRMEKMEKLSQECARSMWTPMTQPQQLRRS